MRPDVQELEAFYRGKRGEWARRLLNLKLRQLWPDVGGDRILGVGFAPPFLSVMPEAHSAVALMPATQGALPFPRVGKNRAVVGREDEFPFADFEFDRVLLVHALECSPHPNRLLREAWRVLRDGGKLIAVVPNRTGLWCWSERTPFGFGQPYTSGQLERLLQAHLFEAVDQRGALWGPPSPLRLLAPGERLGPYVIPRLAGVVMVEAEKRIWLGRPNMAAVRPSSRRYAPIADLAAARAAARAASKAAGHRGDGRGGSLPAAAREAADEEPCLRA